MSSVSRKALSSQDYMATISIRHLELGELPLRKGDPPYSAWGLWGLEDQVGTLVYIPHLPSILH